MGVYDCDEFKLEKEQVGGKCRYCGDYAAKQRMDFFYNNLISQFQESFWPYRNDKVLKQVLFQRVEGSML